MIAPRPGRPCSCSREGQREGLVGSLVQKLVGDLGETHVLRQISGVASDVAGLENHFAGQLALPGEIERMVLSHLDARIELERDGLRVEQYVCIRISRDCGSARAQSPE